MHKKEKILTVALAVLLVIFALVALYFNVLKGGRSTTNINQADKPIQLNNTLKTSVTVLPAPETK